MRMTATVLCLALLAACGRDATPPADAAQAAPPPATEPMPAPTTPIAVAPAFLGTVWRADTGSGVATGTRYTFLADGTLLVEPPSGTPMHGSWRMADGGLVMTEGGIDYPTDVVSHDAEHLHLRSHNPGGVVELVLVRDVRAP